MATSMLYEFASLKWMFVLASISLRVSALSICELVELVELTVWESTAQKEMATREKGTATVIELKTYSLSMSFSHVSDPSTPITHLFSPVAISL